MASSRFEVTRPNRGQDFDVMNDDPRLDHPDLLPTHRAIPFRPDLTKADRERFVEIVRVIENMAPLAQITKVRAARARVSARRIRLRAALCVLEDLLRHSYHVEVIDKHVQVVPDLGRTENGRVDKERQRRLLLVERASQLRLPSVQAFLNEMEKPREHLGRLVSVLDLIANGEELAKRITTPGLHPVKPALEVADGDHVDPWTGLRLQEIWRYFRHTWALPYHTSPGRRLQFLIRDESLPSRPVMGLLGLGNSLIQISARDDAIGWTLASFTKRFRRRHEARRFTAQRPKEWHGGTSEIELTRFLETADEHRRRVRSEGPLVLRVLRRALQSSLRNLNKRLLLPPGRQTRQRQLELLERAMKRAANDEKEMEKNRRRGRSWRAESQTPLFRKKRAKTYWRLLRAQTHFESIKKWHVAEQIRSLTTTTEGQFAVVAALQELKKERVGTSMMDITICGAVPPYNYILGGKLAAMLAVSPTVTEAYRKKYAGAISEIASAMHGGPVRRAARLAFMGTTSLYEAHSVQYDRVQVPIMNGELRYRELGRTAGFTSVHFSEETQELLERISIRRDGRRKDTYKFGEGVNPKLRKISHGLRILGLPERRLTQYWSRRIVYGVPLASNAYAFLRGETTRLNKQWGGLRPHEALQSIVDHWKTRWLTPRAMRPETAEALKAFAPDALVADLHPDV